jgi:hypothetical protein
VHGYLATVTSKSENDFLIANIGPLRSPRGDLWIGGTDDPIDGEWRWVTGPEAGTLFWRGGVNGTEILFADWATGSPNNAFGPASESRLGWVEDGWNDLPASGFASLRPGYIVEYSDVPADGDSRSPAVVELRMDPELLYLGQDGYALAVADDSASGPDGMITGIDLSVDGGDWLAMASSDGQFDENWESSILSIGPYYQPGNVWICARAHNSGDTVSAPVCGTLSVISTAPSQDFQAPVISELNIYRNTVLFGQDNQVTAFADDTVTGSSLIQSLQLRLGTGPWQLMDPVDSSYDETFEAATLVLGPQVIPGANNVCVRVVDTAGNVSAPSCTTYFVQPRASG